MPTTSIWSRVGRSRSPTDRSASPERTGRGGSWWPSPPGLHHSISQGTGTICYSHRIALGGLPAFIPQRAVQYPGVESPTPHLRGWDREEGPHHFKQVQQGILVGLVSHLQELGQFGVVIHHHFQASGREGDWEARKEEKERQRNQDEGGKTTGLISTVLPPLLVHTTMIGGRKL